MPVYLVGAGPGDPGLLTVRGRDLLAGADVVLYDGLVDARVLSLVSPRATLIDVSKTYPGSHPTGGDDDALRGGAAGRRLGGHGGPSQAEIEALLVEYGRRGGRVVRLKGGDPFVFGRGGEEAMALAAAGIAYEVVPGVSAAVAVPAYAGIPVTHRGLAASVVVVTGHEAADPPPGHARVDWAALATAADTLVILMGVGRLEGIATRLIAGGRGPQTPAAIVERGTTPAQRVVSGPLVDLPALAAAAGVRSPAVVVVGEVARLHAQLDWYAAAAAPAPPAGVPDSTAAGAAGAVGEVPR
jgi:uroporphyrinogen III methyltransferase/synthase